MSAPKLPALPSPEVPAAIIAASIVSAVGAPVLGKSLGKNIPDGVDYFNDAFDLVIDGGESESVLPSTIVDATGPELTVLRQGLVDIS